MIIRLNLTALRTVRWYEYLTRFLLGGAITGPTGLIAHRFGADIGGLFLAFPAIFPASATLIEKHERERKRRSGISKTIRGRLGAALEAGGAAIGSIGLCAFVLEEWKGLARFDAALILSVGLGTWLLIAFLIWYPRKKHWRSLRLPK